MQKIHCEMQNHKTDTRQPVKRVFNKVETMDVGRKWVALVGWPDSLCMKKGFGGTSWKLNLKLNLPQPITSIFLPLHQKPYGMPANLYGKIKRKIDKMCGLILEE